MEWTRVDVQSDAEIESIGGLADLKVGLDTDAEIEIFEDNYFF